MNALKNIVPTFLKTLLKRKMGVPNQYSSLIQLRKLGFFPKTILDIGAYEGNWAEEVAAIFPNAAILMIEGQENKKDILLQKASTINNSEVLITLLGSEKKPVNFNIYGTASSIYNEDNYTKKQVKLVDLNILDDIIYGTKFVQTDFIKIDTQGSELEILKGGLKTLSSAKVVLLEVSLLGIYKGAPLVDEVIAFMKRNNFVLYDICSIIRRPYDNALYQSDFLFLKENHQIRSSTRWD